MHSLRYTLYLGLFAKTWPRSEHGHVCACLIVTVSCLIPGHWEQDRLYTVKKVNAFSVPSRIELFPASLVSDIPAG